MKIVEKNTPLPRVDVEANSPHISVEELTDTFTPYISYIKVR